MVKGTGSLSATRRVAEGAEAMPGKASGKTTWVTRRLQSWFSSLLLTHHVAIENKEREMSLRRVTFRSNCKLCKIRGYFNNGFDHIRTFMD